MLVNLTPHPLHIYPPDTPERIVAGSVTPLCVIPPSADHRPARLGQTVIGDDDLGIGIPVQRVEFGPQSGSVDTLPEPVEGTWFIVSLVVGLAASDRRDLLVNLDYVRDVDGSIIGSRKLAVPHHG